MTTARLAVIAFAALAAAPASLRAEEAWRVGILVANNRGPSDRPALRYAAQDAAALAAVLTDLGGFHPDDVQVLRDQPLSAVQGAMAALRQRVATARAANRRVVLLFYFSGHSDGQALELGDERWDFADVRRTLQGVGADVRIAIIDSCKSGALLAQKGARPGPGFDIRFTDDLATLGEAVLTSSAPHEAALESQEIRASFFSHHFVSGLRGAADTSGDGRVTLGEAYRYAFINTLLATSNTLAGPQHPEYDYRLTGQGEIVLTDLLTRGARLSLPEGFDRILIADQGRRQLIAELSAASARRIALPAGRYVVQARRQGHAFEAEVDLKEGTARELAAAELLPRTGALGSAKGDDVIAIEQPLPPHVPDLGLAAGAGVRHGAASATAWMASVHLEAALGRRSGPALALDVARGSADGFRETAGYLAAAYFLGIERGRLRARAGLQVGGGPIVQTIDGGASRWTLAGGAGPRLGAALDLARRLSLGAVVGADGMLLRRDGAISTALWPSAAVSLQLWM